MIGYVTLGTDDLDRARAYFDALLGTIGAKRLMQIPTMIAASPCGAPAWASPAIVVTQAL